MTCKITSNEYAVRLNIPRHLTGSLERTIEFRRAVCTWYGNMAAALRMSEGPVSEKSDKHQYFIDVLHRVKAILEDYQESE